ncbi:BTAD domain-containing putative transcriptional regulator [Micromonospora sp. NPDC049559]|uniref:AfsR/SARP family transcriptional regulator n=1 Tax=Micromonospora sp. NPDC049559 TaxID=3155923 RepID=UPI003441DF55
MDLRVLGEVGIRAGDRFLTLDRAGERCVLAVFALEPGRPIPVETLVERVWGDEPPAKADESIASYVRAVRRVVERAGGARDWLVNRRPRAYLLRVERSAVDYHRFADSITTARALAARAENDQAVSAYRRALDQWDGDPLTGVTGEWADRRRDLLRRERLEAWCGLLDQQLRIGAHDAVAGRVDQLIDEVVPTDRLIKLGLYGLAYCGRHADVPQFLERAERRMWEAVQLRPSPAVGTLARRLMAEAGNRELIEEESVRTDRRLVDGTARSDSPTPSEGANSGRDENAGTKERPTVSGTADPMPLVSMTAISHGNIYQAGGDQYIVES